MMPSTSVRKVYPINRDVHLYSLHILAAPSVDGEGPDADIESPRSVRDNCLTSCENSLDERGSSRGSLLRVIRGISYVIEC